MGRIPNNYTKSPAFILPLNTGLISGENVEMGGLQTSLAHNSSGKFSLSPLSTVCFYYTRTKKVIDK